MKPIDDYMADDPHLAQNTPSGSADSAIHTPLTTAVLNEVVQEPAPLPDATEVGGDAQMKLKDIQLDKYPSPSGAEDGPPDEFEALVLAMVSDPNESVASC